MLSQYHQGPKNPKTVWWSATYFLMSELTGGISKFIMRCACLWINIFPQFPPTNMIVNFCLFDGYFNGTFLWSIVGFSFDTYAAIANFSISPFLIFLKCPFILVSKSLCLFYRYIFTIFAIDLINAWFPSSGMCSRSIGMGWQLRWCLLNCSPCIHVSDVLCYNLILIICRISLLQIS